MENLLTSINSALLSLDIETYSNVVYQVKSPDLEKKTLLKSLLKQGDPTLYHTVVEIDLEVVPPTTQPPNTPLKNKNIELKIENATLRINNSPIYVFGRYIKMSREMSQTPLLVREQPSCSKRTLKTEKSVSDFASSFGKFYQGEAKFMGCGREDIDVQCLEGRPFMLEITNPKKHLHEHKVPVELCEGIRIIDCSIVRRECKDYVNNSSPWKQYRILMYSKERIEIEERYLLKQRTPLRVLHRRADLMREREIEVLRWEVLEREGFYYGIEIRAMGGAYIKEWVNGDFGRTKPSLGGDLLELDVIKVELEIREEFIMRRLKIVS